MQIELLRRVAASAAILVCALCGSAKSGEVLSTANDPFIRLDTRIESLLTREKTMLGRLDAGRLTRLSTLPPGEVAVTRPDGITYSNTYLDTVPQPSKNAAWECLTEALYFEARGESVMGQFAVAEVILNRVDRREFPGTVCDVVNQGTGRKHACQFSYTCDGKPEEITDDRAYARVGKVAGLLLGGAERLLTQGSTHYHTIHVNPNWASVFPRTTTIGEHHFYYMR